MENRELIKDLVTWIAKEPRRYEDVMDAWRTSCPRLPIWEDAVEFGFIERAQGEDGTTIVRATETGRAFLLSLNAS
ncbi:MAG: hypothetical protein AAFY99_14040 [Pseudomonadota bacterium]